MEATGIVEKASVNINCLKYFAPALLFPFLQAASVVTNKCVLMERER